MITRTLYLITFAGGLIAALASGCGGKVIVDGVANEGGQGGQGTSTNSTSVGEMNVVVSTGASSGSTCGFPPPVGAITFCGGTGSGGPGSVSCDTIICDQAGNRYEANCTNDSCVCTLSRSDGSLVASCSCTLASECSSSIPCCPLGK